MNTYYNRHYYFTVYYLRRVLVALFVIVYLPKNQRLKISSDCNELFYYLLLFLIMCIVLLYTYTVATLWSNNNNIHLFSLVQLLGGIEKQITKETNKIYILLGFILPKKKRFNNLFFHF